MPAMTPQDFWEMDRSWSGERSPAPGISRSMANLGMGVGSLGVWRPARQGRGWWGGRQGMLPAMRSKGSGLPEA